MINYYLLMTKPGIIAGNLVTFAAGFLLASKGKMHWELFFASLIGLALIMASACVFNNYLDRNLDKKMKRTQNRPLVQGLISERNALIFGTCLGILGFGILAFFTNGVAVSVAAVG